MAQITLRCNNMSPKARQSNLDECLAKGLGRVLQRILSTGVLEDPACIIDACVHNRCYDADVEGSRAAWMLQILDAAQATENLAQAILRAMRTVSEPRDLQQSCDLAEVFAQRGIPGARTELAHMLDLAWCESDPSVAYGAHLRLDGSAALVALAANRGALLAQGSDPQGEGYYDLMNSAEDTFGKRQSEAILREAAQTHADVQRWWDRCRETEAMVADSSSVRDEQQAAQRAAWAGLSGAEVARDIRAKGIWPVAEWQLTATNADLLAVAEAMEAEASPVAQQHLWHAVGRRWSHALALVPVLLRMTEHASVRLRHLAFFSLQRHHHPDIRALALQRAHAGFATHETTSLFVSNYESGDERLFWDLLDRHDSTDAYESHRMLEDIIDVFVNNPRADGAALLAHVYGATPCALCRSKCVAQMLKTRCLPQSLAQECSYDSLEETRLLMV